MSKKSLPAKPNALIRCAIYTRKSTEEGLEQEFNTLDAQRLSGENYIKSQVHEGLDCLPDRYDDGGYTGGNMDRPALKRLMADIEAGKVDSVVVYKVDRLSRSLLDFAKMVEIFDRQGVSFVSVTQLINTSTSMGRLMLNVLLSFAQFEREIISERTRDKIAASRRKGMWSGGMPVLGYDLDPKGPRLLVNPDEAVRVRKIFELYLKHQSLIATLKELETRGWVSKCWKTRKGPQRGGQAFTKHSLHRLLTNIVYIGRIKYKAETHAGEHEAIVDPAVFEKVQLLLQRNGRTGGREVRNQFGALLKGLLRCVPCGCAMSPAHTTKAGSKRYRYYVCGNAQKRGWHTCPSRSIPATEIERLVIDQIRKIGRDPTLLDATIAEAHRQAQDQLEQLEAETRGHARELTRWTTELQKLDESANVGAITQKADLRERISASERRSAELSQQVANLSRQVVDPRSVAQALRAFEPLWETLSPREQTRVVQLLVEGVDYDGAASKVSIRFHATGLQSLSAELAGQGGAA